MADFDFGIDLDFVDDGNDAAIDRWHDGAIDAYARKARASADADYLAGYDFALDDLKSRPPVIERPEGYYHAPIGAFD